MSKRIRIQDSGALNSQTYENVGLPDWIELPSDRLTYEFTVKQSNHEAAVVGEGNSLTFNSNEVSAIIPPRFTVNFYIPATDTARINKLIALQRSKNIKKLTGGMGLISAIPEKFTEGSDDIIFINIKNMTGSEIISEDKEFIKFTLQLEQVQ